MSTANLDKSAIMEDAKYLTCNQIAAKHGIPPSTMHGYLRRNGIAALAIKRDYSKYDGLDELCQTMTKRELADHYGVVFSTIESALARKGLEAKRAPNYIDRSTYNDIAEMCKVMTVRQLTEHYGRSEDAVRKALAKRGLSAVYVRNPLHMRKEKQRKAVQKNYTDNWGKRPQVSGRVETYADQAANFLRKECAVYRCKEDGKPDWTASHWRFGRRVMTEEELINTAKRKGWNGDQWGSMAA